MRKTILKILLAIVLLIGAIYLFLYFFVDDILLLTVPTNRNFIIPKDIPIDKIIPQEIGGNNYTDSVFGASKSDWIKSCLSALKLDDEVYKYLCEGFRNGYEREYDAYVIEEQEIRGTENNKVLVVNVLEYKSSYDAKNGASFYTLETVLPKLTINGVKVIGYNYSDFAYYLIPIPYSNKLISIYGNPSVIEDATRLIIAKYKR